jgi:Skp family chaperone for outer membrane proteins
MNVYRRHITPWPSVLALLLLPVAGAWAQGGESSAPAVPAKIAVINVRQAIVATAEGKQASAELQTRFSPQQAELQTLQRQIQDLQNRLNNGSSTLSDDEKGRLQREGELMARQYQRKQEDLNDEVSNAQSDLVDSIGRKMLDVLDRYSRQHGYAVVLDTSAQGSPVIYGATQVDITKDIIRLYDQAHPVKTTSDTPPARPRASSGASKKPSK